MRFFFVEILNRHLTIIRKSLVRRYSWIVPIPEVLHLSTSGSGGAGIAAKRLNQGLNMMGINSKFLSLPGKKPNFEENEFGVGRGKLHTIQSAGLSLIENRFSSRTFFSPISLTVIPLREIVDSYDAAKTVIHIHNWFNLINLESVGMLVKHGFKIVLTLHDQRLMTGGCHYSLGCNLYETGCKLCPELPPVIARLPGKIHKIEGKCLRKIQNNCVLVAPSEWMNNEAKKSMHLRNFETQIIPNFIPDAPNEVHNRKVAEVQEGKKITLGVASENPYAYIKGGEFIKTLEEDMNFLARYRLIFMKNYSDAAEFWKEIDFLFVPSINDNSPNVISEAKIRSIPVIASAVGGIPELMYPEFDELVDLENLTAVYFENNFNELRYKLNNSGAKEDSRIRFQKHRMSVLKKHIDLYTDLINKR